MIRNKRQLVPTTIPHCLMILSVSAESISLSSLHHTHMALTNHKVPTPSFPWTCNENLGFFLAFFMHINDVQKRVHNPCFINHIHLIITKMEKSRSFPQYSSEFRYENGSDPYSFNGPSEKCRGFEASNDPEMKRKKRIAGYNMFTTEGKVKASFRESFKWIKTKINDARYNI